MDIFKIFEVFRYKTLLYTDIAIFPTCANSLDELVPNERGAPMSELNGNHYLSDTPTKFVEPTTDEK